MSEMIDIDAYDLCSKVLVATGFDAGPLIELTKGSEADWLEFKESPNPASP
jgi:hypothetical protein